MAALLSTFSGGIFDPGLCNDCERTQTVKMERENTSSRAGAGSNRLCAHFLLCDDISSNHML